MARKRINRYALLICRAYQSKVYFCAKPITIGTNYLTYNMIHKLSFNFWENNKRVKTDRNTILNIKIQ